MALTLSKTGIEQTQVINDWHVTQSIDAFTGTSAYDITISGSLDISDSVNTGDLIGTASWASNAVTASYAITATDSLNATKLVATSNFTTNQAYNVPYASTSSATYEQFYKEDGSDMTYNPSTNTLTVTNFEGTASLATTAATATTATTATKVTGEYKLLAGPGFNPGQLAMIAGSGTLVAGSAGPFSPTFLAGKTFLTDFWVTATRVSGSAAPVGSTPLYVDSLGAGNFFIKEIGGSSADEVNFTVMYLV